jgi:lipopolysaccharide/colanic/teichoic acid biosynthesis glycosyltransferase
MLSKSQTLIKRATDIVGAALGLLCFGWLVLLAAVVARIETGHSGFYRQVRVGLNGRRFTIFKIRTMHEYPEYETTVTVENDPRVTRCGHIFRKSKIDELPQLINVLRGDMSLVGPRPDVPELAGSLMMVAPVVLSVRPGITGPASLKYRCEEALLAAQADPEWVNDVVIFADKIRINENYVRHYSWLRDFKYLWQTILGGGKCCSAAQLEEMATSANSRIKHTA